MQNFVFLFDIDGTLLTVQNDFMRPLIRTILDKLNIDYPNMERDSFAGRTDFDIFNSFIDGHEQQEEIFSTLKKEYLISMDTHLDRSHIHLIAGAQACLDVLQSKNSHMGLVTGNFKQSGYKKLKASGIDSYFNFGGFGDDHKDRNLIPPLAYENFTSVTSITRAPEQFIIIGDTPKDIICAKVNNAKSVAVTTGHYSAEELKEYKPDLVLDNLENPEEWVSQLL